MLQRLLRDYNELADRFFVYPVQESLDKFYLVIIGPDNTPYAHIPFVFIVTVPDTYPFDPPSISYLSFTTNKIHPNLYINGKVCLSIIGTYIGPDSLKTNREYGWNPVMTLSSLAYSIQSILHDKPLLQEPCEKDTSQENIQRYNHQVHTECMNSIHNYETLFMIPPVKEYVMSKLHLITKNKP
jgi:ubiquitin-conjugating enzyme E2 Z